jgi:hypothetical protein
MHHYWPPGPVGSGGVGGGWWNDKVQHQVPSLKTVFKEERFSTALLREMKNSNIILRKPNMASLFMH